MDWQTFTAWNGLLYLGGAVGGYLLFVLMQPCSWAFRDAYRVARRYSFVWLGVALFAIARETFGTIRLLLYGDIEVRDFLGAGTLGLAPVVREVVEPVFSGTLEMMLSMQTIPVTAFPLSVLVFFLFLFNRAGAISALARPAEGHRVTAWGVLLVLLVVLAGVVHVAGVLRDLAPGWFEGWLPAAALPVLRWGGGLFAAMLGYAVLVWVLWWLIQLGLGGQEERWKFTRGAIEKARATWWVPVLFWGLFSFWQNAETGVLSMAPNAWRAGGIVFSWFLLVPIILFLDGQGGFLNCLFRRQGGWWVAHWERFIWWGMMAVLHLFLLSFLAELGQAVISPLSIAWFGWNLFFALLRAALTVWLLGALISLVLEGETGVSEQGG